MTDGLLVLGHEHDRGTDEHEALHDEEEHVDVTAERERDGTAATAHASTATPVAVVAMRRDILRASVGVMPVNTSTGPTINARNDEPAPGNGEQQPGNAAAQPT